MNQQINLSVKIGSEAAIGIVRSFRIPKEKQDDRKKLAEYLEKKADAMIKEVLKTGIGEKKFMVSGDNGRGCWKINHYPPHRITNIEAIFPLGA